jgi:signal peptidase I
MVFLWSNLPMMTRFGMSTSMVNTASGVIGAVCVALFTMGVFSFKVKPAKKLVLMRNEEGRVISITQGEVGLMWRKKAVAFNGQPVLKTWNGRSKYIGVAIVVLVLSYASFMALVGYTFQDAARGIYSPFLIIASGSMQPFLNPGDLIILKKERVEKIEIGDVIAFDPPSPYDKAALSPTIHRVIKKWIENGNTYLKTKGDNVQSEDPWNLSEENVIGKIIWKLPYIGLVVLLLKAPWGLAFIATSITLYYIYLHYGKKEGGG